MKIYTSISDDLAEWAQRQPVFCTGSAPTYGSHVNVSPKGLDAHFAVLGPNQVAYIDRTGSGNETISHAYENERLCIMFMSFGPSPRILRFFCKAKIIEWDQPEFPELVHRISKGKDTPNGARAVVLAHVWEVQTSCGFGVPKIKKALYDPDEAEAKLSLGEMLQKDSNGQFTEISVFEERSTLNDWVSKRVADNTVGKYQEMNNTKSMDGLPGLKTARRDLGETLWIGDARARAMRVSSQKEGILVGFLGALLMIYLLSMIA